jgi:hypothetical protein
MSTKFVQIKALGSKLAPPRGWEVIVFPYICKVKTLKNLSFKNHKELELRYSSLFNKNLPRPRGLYTGERFQGYHGPLVYKK